MIVDSHVYCFEPVDRPAGHASAEEHLRWVQAAHARHHQPAWRVRDRAPAASTALDPDSPFELSKLPHVDFRVDHARGRVVWTIDGEDYTKQFFPPNLRNLEFTPHSLIAEMDYAAVDVALIHTDPMLGRESEYLAGCVQLYPDRLRSMAPVDEWRILSETDAVMDELTAAIITHQLHAIKFNAPLAYLNSAGLWDDGGYRPFWEAAVSLDVPIFFTLGTGPTEPGAKISIAEQRRGYLSELRTLIRWMERYPGAVCSLTHGFPWRVFLEGDRIKLPEAIWAPFQNPNCSLEVCFPVRLGDLFEYPYREVWPTFEEMLERVGADRLLWGTDMPFQSRFCTYRQSRSWIEKHCSFLSEEDLSAIMGGTAARILGLLDASAQGTTERAGST
jgi:predicted TIM-barrel fold metal-dependent hydrolase